MATPEHNQGESSYGAKEGVLETDLGDELVLLDPDTQQMYTLNETGRRLWRNLPGASPGALAEGMSSAFEVGLEQAKQDAKELLEQLEAAGLITPEE